MTMVKLCPECEGHGEKEITVIGEQNNHNFVAGGQYFKYETLKCELCNGTGVVKQEKKSKK